MKRSREIAGVISLAVAIFLLLCLFSYHPSDPSFTHFVAGTAKTHNLIGSFGSYIADSLIKLFGISVIWFPIFFTVIAFKYFLNTGFRIGVVGINAFFGLLMATSGLAAVALADISLYGIKLRSGGLLGHLLDRFLSAFLSNIGAYIVLIVMLIIALMILVDLSVVSFITQLKNRALAIYLRGSGLFMRLVDKMKERKMIPAMSQKRATAPVIEEPPAKTDPIRPVKVSQTHFDFVRSSGGKFDLPPLNLLDQIPRKDTRMKRDSLIATSRILETKLADFSVEGKVVEVKPGPVITMYELEPAPGVKINKITNLSDDLALALRAPSIRIIAPIPGKAAVGIEIPNNTREPVQLLDVLDHEAFLKSPLKLPIALGVDIVGSPVITDLIRMPHLLIAGTTGSGKSVCLNAMICSILFKSPPGDVKFLMIDPKRLELSAYERIPHLLHPVVVNPKKASLVLRWAVEEMERRYEVISELGVKGIESYNRLIDKALSGKGKTAQPTRERAAGDPGHAGEDRPGTAQLPAEIANRQKLPYIVIVIDELADLMMVAQRNVEESLARLAQMARAAGIHLILATQRPSVDVITGVIKANFPTRISFQVSSKVDSRTIIDQHGAEKLLGAGDMLFIPPGTSKLVRIHGAYVSDKEIDRIVAYICHQATPAYDQSIAEYQHESPEGEKAESDVDEKYDEAVELVADLGQASISLVQRYMKIGYNRAARMIERMEAEGIVGPSDGVKPRKVLVRKHPK
jgi:S-DNA-T family DNA segregation ATPase FtsK/SpoIIIE